MKTVNLITYRSAFENADKNELRNGNDVEGKADEWAAAAEDVNSFNRLALSMNAVEGSEEFRKEDISEGVSPIAALLFVVQRFIEFKESLIAIEDGITFIGLKIVEIGLLDFGDTTEACDTIDVSEVLSLELSSNFTCLTDVGGGLGESQLKSPLAFISGDDDGECNSVLPLLQLSELVIPLPSLLPPAFSSRSLRRRSAFLHFARRFWNHTCTRASVKLIFIARSKLKTFYEIINL